MDKTDKPKWSIIEKILQPVCLLIVIVGAILLAASWNTIPETVPKHFNALGKPDSWENKSGIIFLIVLQIALYLLLTLVERFPKLFNFPFEITEKNVLTEYQIARELLVCMKTEIVIVFSYINFYTIQTAKGHTSGLGFAFLPVFLGILTLTIVFYIVRMNRCKD